MYYGGGVLGAFIVPRLSDLYGRKPFVIGCALLHVFASIFLLSLDNLTVAYAMIFIQGFCMPGRAIVGYIWFTESIIKEHVTTSTSLIFFVDSFGNFFASLYFRYLSKDWTYFYAVPVILIFVSTLTLCFFEDTPKYYFSKKQYDKAR